MRRTPADLREIVMLHLMQGARGTAWALARDLSRNPSGVRDALVRMEQEGLVRRTRERVRTARSHGGVRHETLFVWEWAQQPIEQAPVITQPDEYARIAARRAVLLRARESMGALAEWAHGRAA